MFDKVKCENKAVDNETISTETKESEKRLVSLLFSLKLSAGIKLYAIILQ